jgi:hypothetical protein
LASASTSFLCVSSGVAAARSCAAARNAWGRQRPPRRLRPDRCPDRLQHNGPCKIRLASLLNGAPESLRYNDHQIGHGPAFHQLACEHGLEGIISKRTSGRYEPDRRTWLKVKCLNREEFVVVGWSDPEGSRHRIGALLLGYYTPEGKLTYAGRAGTGLPEAELERLWRSTGALPPNAYGGSSGRNGLPCRSYCSAEVLAHERGK